MFHIYYATPETKGGSNKLISCAGVSDWTMTTLSRWRSATFVRTSFGKF
jgi:hypothetical protein